MDAMLQQGCKLACSAKPVRRTLAWSVRPWLLGRGVLRLHATALFERFAGLFLASAHAPCSTMLRLAATTP
eukprot:9049612-Pyramimonas_sp.AAC.1